MTISIITPSYNQAQFLPETLRSVAAQSQPALEHIVIDPGSNDGSRDIARQAQGITLVAEPDEGQSDAICKGFAMAKGDVMAWLNSDDYYADNKVLQAVAQRFDSADKPDVVYGNVIFVDQNGKKLKDGYVNKNTDGLRQSFHYQVGIVQPGVFIHRRVFEAVGGPPLDMHFTLDYEYWVRIAEAGFKWGHLDRVLACHRWWDGMKTASRRVESLYEHFDTCKKHFGYVHYKWVERQADCILEGADGVVTQAGEPTVAPEIKEAKLRQLLLEANGDLDTLSKLNSSDNECLLETARYMKALKIPMEVPYFVDPEKVSVEKTGYAKDGDDNRPVAWRRYTARTPQSRELYGYEVTNNFSACYDKVWLDIQLQRSSDRLKELRSKRRSDICIVVGNGPSLRKTDFSLFEGYDVIISNFSTLDQKLQKLATYHTVTNFLVAKQGCHQFNRLEGLIKIYPYWLSHFLLPNEDTFYLNALLTPEASTDVTDWISWRSTVSFFNLQLAYSLGFKKVIMVGFDHAYKQDAQAKEGDLIHQKDDDENHFLKSYFKNKVWQAADVEEMEKTYRLAKAAFDADGREIVNCTVGGKLELFRRANLAEELSVATKQSSGLPGATEPRVLIVDVSCIGSISATGQIKERLFSKFDRRNLLQIFPAGEELLRVWDGRVEGGKQSGPLQPAQIRDRVLGFRPDVVYFRPTDDAQTLCDWAQTFLKTTNIPYVLHIMDDWPERLRIVNPERYQKRDSIIKQMIADASVCLAIGTKMAGVFKARYGRDFTPLGNGVEDADFPPLHPPREKGSPMRLVYSGAIAAEMNLDSVLLVAQCVSELSKEIPISMEIITMPYWITHVGHLFANLENVILSNASDSASEYRNKLAEADLLLLAYNFDEHSLAYNRYSVGNKLPECLCSGTPLLALGPDDHATIELANEMPSVLHVGTQNIGSIKQAILEVYQDPSAWADKASKSRDAVTAKFSLNSARLSLSKILADTSKLRHGDLNAFPAPTVDSTENQPKANVQTTPQKSTRSWYTQFKEWKLFRRKARS